MHWMEKLHDRLDDWKQAKHEKSGGEQDKKTSQELQP